MNRSILIILIIIIILVGGGLLLIKLNKSSNNVEQLMQINTTLEWEQGHHELYDELKRELDENPEDYSALFKLGRLKQDLLDYDGAIELYQRLSQEKQEDIMPLINMASIYYDTKQYEKAEETHYEILQRNLKWLNSYRELLSIYRWHLKDKKAVLEPILLDAYEKIPEFRQDLTSLLAVYYDELIGDKAKAIEWYEKQMQFNSDPNIEVRINELQMKE